ncbi:TIGR02996 domain-containing protein [Tuwongella immobilis]|uniref:Repeat-companion domain protein n=1 Tax=Tuwongella immobilis TaxID=692036 RepID=A0A6C2YSZ4_9BACT|nr:TIGR02996 domain-containing protein [Tuwongella immobilis]VIP04840.1 unnamed protein product [Tuwongella immobilis]VTS07040.1 unnamed protein product [Tuwongella immobilis]
MSLARDGLLNAIATADAWDDTPWLALADWLEEAGNPDHALLRRLCAIRVPGMLDLEWMRAWGMESVRLIRDAIGSWPCYQVTRRGWLRVELRLESFRRLLERGEPLIWPTEILLKVDGTEAVAEARRWLQTQPWPGVRLGLRVVIGTAHRSFPAELSGITQLTHVQVLIRGELPHGFPFSGSTELPGVRGIHIPAPISLRPEQIRWLAQQPKLESLSLHVTTPLTAAPWWPLAESRALRSLQIQTPSPLDAEVLRGWSVMRNLQTLEWESLGPIAPELFERLQHCSLQELNLRGGNHLVGCRMAGFHQVESVSLSGITRPIPASWLQQIAQLPRLRLLDLTGCVLDDAGLAAIVEAPNLEELNLHGVTGVTARGFDRLLAAPALRLLDVARCSGTTPERVRIFRDRRPECRVSAAHLATDFEPDPRLATDSTDR